MKTLTLELSDADYDLLSRHVLTTKYHSIRRWAAWTLVEIARSHEALRELDKAREAAKVEPK